MRIGARSSASFRRPLLPSDGRFHVRERGFRDDRKLVRVPWIALLARLPLLGTLYPGIRRLPPLLARFSKNGAESRDRSHEKRDTAFQGLPKDLPYRVGTAAGIGNSTHPNDRENDHHRGETEKEAHRKLLPSPDFGSSKKDDGYADDFHDHLVKRFRFRDAGESHSKYR